MLKITRPLELRFYDTRAGPQGSETLASPHTDWVKMSPLLSQNNISTNAESDKIRNYALFGKFLGVGQISELQ